MKCTKETKCDTSQPSRDYRQSETSQTRISAQNKVANSSGKCNKHSVTIWWNIIPESRSIINTVRFVCI